MWERAATTYQQAPLGEGALANASAALRPARVIYLERRARPPQEALHASFGLTAAEARLAIKMASGAALETVADELRISKETARNQLKAVFHKTGVRRQAELVALLASFLNSRG